MRGIVMPTLKELREKHVADEAALDDLIDYMRELTATPKAGGAGD